MDHQDLCVLRLQQYLIFAHWVSLKIELIPYQHICSKSLYTSAPWVRSWTRQYWEPSVQTMCYPTRRSLIHSILCFSYSVFLSCFLPPLWSLLYWVFEGFGRGYGSAGQERRPRPLSRQAVSFLRLFGGRWLVYAGVGCHGHILGLCNGANHKMDLASSAGQGRSLC